MKRTTFGKAALSSLLVATTMVGCTGAAFRPSASAVQQKGNPGKLAIVAEKALADRNAVKAVEAAEAVVQLQPQNAAYRQILGRAYVLAGRFASAETALSDAMTLGNSDASTIVSLALVQVAQGRADSARSLLVANAGTVPAGDYGLAMAMTGDTAEGVRILSEAIHDPSATARTRQNLAYAYALAGRWKDARMIVGMDLEPLAANKRISDWAQIAEPSLAPMRVAALMGVTIDQGDAGQPVALALAPAAAAAPIEMAQTAPDIAPLPESPPEAPVQVAEAASAPQPVVVSAPVMRAERAPARVAVRDFIIEDGNAKPVLSKSRVAKGQPAVAAAPVARMQQAAFIKPVANGASNWVVQLGAYDNAAIAKEKWMSMAGRSGALAAFPVLTSQATVKGKTYHRLAISGFGSRADAMTACRMIRARSGQCFVREGAPGATPQRWAVAAKGRQYASR
ncbi:MULTISPECIES: SPOR domain-containing protein [Sphingobium]|uniref:Tetratricopeptide repeat protein n=1 Tax=Sphingobium cupriresistens TaxID=1132417 RepID=A0A8G1ZD67_9SPHN|nr:MULTISPECIES: SPOR domain-containing protein [Sphingobium]MBJ7376894.1 SPOR domain-containing protein [Sphingobium sp.]RYM07691.1 tetratricopeptide repeat protein [Sphingobium cupriresistens]